MSPRRQGILALLLAGSIAGSCAEQPQPQIAAPGGGKAPSRAAAATLIGHLDGELNAGRWDGFLGAFDQRRQPVFWNSLIRRVEDMKQLERLRVKSRLLDYFVRGDAGVAIVKTELNSEFGRRDLVTYTALTQRDAGVRALFAIESHPYAAQLKVGKSGAFECAACNYRVRFGPDWLAVPRCPTRSKCMEALWLVSLVDDVHIDFAVHVGETEVSAKTALENCLNTTRSRKWIAAGMEPRFEAWRPEIAGWSDSMNSMRCTTRCRGDLVAEMNMIVHGRLRYLMVVRGAARVIYDGSRRAEIDGILASFTILDPGITAAQIAHNATHVHSGKGVMRAGNLYHNPRAQVQLRGPEGWRSEVRAGACLFELEFTDPGNPDNALRVQAQGPVGGPWSTERVDGIIRARRAKRPQVEVSDWQRRGGMDVIDLRIGDRALGSYALRPDMLLILNGMVSDDAAVEELREAMQSAQSLKD